jgi:PhnB protein
MHKPSNPNKFVSAIFITFSGKCKEALTFYQTCFGGTLQFQTFEKELPDYIEKPVVSGSLVADNMVIHGSDLVHNEGRIIGNYMAMFIQCATASARKELIEKLSKNSFSISDDDEKLIEIVDAFDVRWVL